MIGLSRETEIVLNKISNFDFCKEYTLIGGTALSMQIGHRLSVDLDFCKWKQSKFDKPVLSFDQIEKEMIKLGDFKKDLIDFNFANYYLTNGVKLSFYANQLYKSPIKKSIIIKDLIKVPDIKTIGAMKLELMLRRSVFRDYYDIYAILKEGVSLKEMIYRAGKYTNHRLKSKNIISFIVNGENYQYESSFPQLKPKYNVNSEDISKFIIQCYKKEFQTPNPM